MSSYEIHLFRHGRTQSNVTTEHKTTGQSLDEDLDEAGYRQADQLGAYLKEKGLTPDVVYSSPAKRAQMTGHLSLQSADLLYKPIKTDLRLAEQNLGDHEGKPRDEVYTPKTIERLKQEGADYRHPNGESMREVADRGQAWLTEATATETEGGTVIFTYTHKVWIACRLAHAAGIEEPRPMRDRVRELLGKDAAGQEIIGNASHTLITIGEDGRQTIEFVGERTNV